MTSVSKNVYIDKSIDIVNKYDNTYHSTTEMKPVRAKNQALLLNLVKNLMKKVLNLKLVILLEYQKVKTFLQKAICQSGLKKLL